MTEEVTKIGYNKTIAKEKGEEDRQEKDNMREEEIERDRKSERTKLREIEIEKNRRKREKGERNTR